MSRAKRSAQKKPEFPLLWSYIRLENDELETLGCPRTVPWSLVEPHERQAQTNHSQTLKVLASRGGLCPHELLAVLEDKRWNEVKDIPLKDVVSRLKEIIEQG